MFRFVFVLLLIALSAVGSLKAQTPAALKKQGEKAFAAGQWMEALQALNAYQEAKPGDAGVLAKLGIAHYHLHQPDKARQFLEYVTAKNPNSKDAQAFLFLGRTLHGIGEFERAIPAFKSYLRLTKSGDPLRAAVTDDIRRCANAMQMPFNDQVALVENLGNVVNTAGDEIAPLPSLGFADRLYFSAARETSTGGKRNEEGLEDENGHYCADMYVTRLRNSGWTPPQPVSSLLNTARHEVALDFAPNGQILYYFRGFSLFAGDILADTASKRDEYALEAPTFDGPLEPRNGDVSLFFVNDTVLLFASRRDSGQGGLDLYFSRLSGDAWTIPQNLGNAVNSGYDETHPFLARDGKTLYFSSNRNTGIGGFDVYQTVYDKGAWSAPVNMGQPLNTPGNDLYFRLAPDGHAGYYCSDRLDSKGGYDLYIAYFKEELAEQSEDAGSDPVFALAQKKSSAQEVAAVEEMQWPSLLYTSDKDVLQPENNRHLDDIYRAAVRFPASVVMVTAHTDDSGPAKFDLYYGIKRAEMIGKALLDRGLPPNRLQLRSAGSGFPIARNVIDAIPNPAGRQLNRRIDVTLVPTDGQELPLRLQRPEVSPLMAVPGTQRLDEGTGGLSYKVELAVTSQIITNDALSMFSDLTIDSPGGSGQYRYAAGLFKKFSEAAALRRDLLGQGFAEARVQAYLNGLSLTRPAAISLLKTYPDLAAWIRG